MTKRLASAFVRISTAVVVVVMLAACSGPVVVPEQGSFGPLAVIEDNGSGQSDALGGTGTVVIGERCVELDVQDHRRLLAWRSADVRWDSAARSIVFAPRGQRPTIISNNMKITVGGEALATDAPARGGNPPVADIRWLATPDSQCSTDVFIVHSIRTAP